MSRKEELYVLYGSQMGNSEGAAKDFCRTIQEKYKPDFFDRLDLSPIEIDPSLMYLHFNYPAPLGAYRFRELCEEFMLDDDMDKVLSGLRYAICGLGDSAYPTFLKNPTTIDNALTTVGAKRIGQMGKCDASATGDNSQDKVIKKWSQDILVPLAKALADDTEVDTSSMQSKTIPLLMKLDPDYTPPGKDEKSCDLLSLVAVGAVVVAGVAVFIANR
eukprot:scaffold5395_cov126-Cylindrotheca_fusiformis.AAC.6